MHKPRYYLDLVEVCALVAYSSPAPWCNGGIDLILMFCHVSYSNRSAMNPNTVRVVPTQRSIHAADVFASNHRFQKQIFNSCHLHLKHPRADTKKIWITLVHTVRPRKPVSRKYFWCLSSARAAPVHFCFSHSHWLLTVDWQKETACSVSPF